MIYHCMIIHLEYSRINRTVVLFHLFCFLRKKWLCCLGGSVYISSDQHGEPSDLWKHLSLFKCFSYSGVSITSLMSLCMFISGGCTPPGLGRPRLARKLLPLRSPCTRKHDLYQPGVASHVSLLFLPAVKTNSTLRGKCAHVGSHRRG